MARASDERLSVYLKLIDYKRSIGTTQWSVLSIFLTASQAAFVFGLSRPSRSTQILVMCFAVFIYWLGFLLYGRYRNFNKQVSSYLVKLEADLEVSFQTHLERSFHGKKGLSTEAILIGSGIIYTLLAAAFVVMAVVSDYTP